MGQAPLESKLRRAIRSDSFDRLKSRSRTVDC